MVGTTNRSLATTPSAGAGGRVIGKHHEAGGQQRYYVIGYAGWPVGRRAIGNAGMPLLLVSAPSK